MSQQYGFPPPPPTPSHGFFPQRQRAAVQPPSITTAVARVSSTQSQTPSSGTSSLSTPFPFSPHTSSFPQQGSSTPVSPRPPSMASQPYNPRQWSQRGQSSGSQMVFQRNMQPSTRDATGMEAAMPSPPPPYTPETPEGQPRSVRPSPMLESGGFTTSPLTVDNSTVLSISARHSPQVPTTPSFPPPPPQSSRYRETSSSGMAREGNRSFFSLSSLTSRGKQPVTNEVQASGSRQPPLSPSSSLIQDFTSRPPASRRAASTGHIGVTASAPTSAVSAGRSSPEQSGWEPGMPLPPPPPGPPPAGARSQSLNRYPPSRSNSGTSSNEEADSHVRRRAAAQNNLGAIPPTPADWVDEELAEQGQQSYQPLRIDTGAHSTASTAESSLARRPARRDASAQGLRERRSRSRAANNTSSTLTADLGGSDRQSDDDSRQTDLVSSPTEGSITRRRLHNRKPSGVSPQANQQTFSPEDESRNVHPGTSMLTPPYTPAVDNQTAYGVQKRVGVAPNSAVSGRPVSHLLHAPIENSGMLVPQGPGRPPTADSATKSPTQPKTPFFAQALERHQKFVEQEAAANSDGERLELFANFMVHESRLRRDRYSAAYNAMAGDIIDLTRDMWRSHSSSKRAITPSTSISSLEQGVSTWASDRHGAPSSASSMAEFTPGTDAGSQCDPADLEQSESQRWEDRYKPSLSPIPSMAVSTVPDEDSSRGRAPSRWWEESASGSSGRGQKVERSQRETKYMGVNPAKLQETAEPAPNLSRQTPTPGASTQTFQYGPNEYPPEKTGWHDNGDFETPLATPAKTAERKPSTSGIEPLDVSRLVTLPPPYPRHHPAVNNNHPSLSSFRSEHRILADHSDVQAIKDGYLDEDWTQLQQHQEMNKERRSKLRSTIQESVMAGNMSFADAAKAEEEFEAEEADRGKAQARANFDLFEARVAHPLNTLLTAKIQKANASIDQLRAELESRNEVADPNQAQEEGDEQPERLEKLTLLKWLFEAREQLHKEMFDLHASRSEKYSEVILTPYRISRQQAKIDEATSFFARDSRDRQSTFARESHTRFESLLNIFEKNVTRGVEDQLSAFWDIAPGLLGVVQQVSPESPGFQIEIPPREYKENLAYQRFPLQYLFTVLNHAEKSAYQFIESQTNMLCLLHEVRTAAMRSSLRLGELLSVAELPAEEAGAREELRTRTERARAEEEERLDGDLKEKVGEVERQWREALGDGLDECKSRVRVCLEESGGWEDGLDG